ncbi:MAG: DUF1934 domain-containing protein [Sporolactobacillus sp.]
MQVHPAKIIFTSRLENAVQSNESNNSPRSVVVRGRIAEGVDGLYLLFSDTVDEAGSLDYSIKLGKNEALIQRKGILPLHQPLTIGAVRSGQYGSPLGELPMEALARQIQSSWDAETGRGEARLIYDLTLQKERVGRFHMTFTFSRLDESADF